MPGFEAIDREELHQIEKVFEIGGGILFRHGFESLRGNSYMVQEFEENFAHHFKVHDALAVSSGTAAIRVALASLGVGEGDEVITQSFTFVATVEAIVESGATPVITEINDTLNMDPEDLRRKITSKTKAIIPVHMLGTPAAMDQVLEIAAEFSIPVVEDTAWGCGGTLGGHYLGTLGDVGCFSFDFAKTITTGEGGMVVAKNPAILEKAKAWHDHGHENNPSVPRWEDTRSSSGFNFRMSELQGAVGIAQLRKLDGIVSRQREVHASLAAELQKVGVVELRKSPVGSSPSCDALIFQAPSAVAARAVRHALQEKSLGSTKILPEAISWHFAGSWTHIASLVEKHGDLHRAFPISLDILEKSVALPISINDSGEMHPKIADAIAEALSK